MDVDPVKAPLLSELPLGVGASFLAVAAACLYTLSDDRTFLVALCSVIGIVLIAISIVMAQNDLSDASPGDLPSGGHRHS
jgi:hypothetical protein